MKANEKNNTVGLFVCWLALQHYAILLTQRNSKNGTLIPHFIKSLFFIWSLVVLT